MKPYLKDGNYKLIGVDLSISRRKASRLLETGKIMTQICLRKSHPQKNILSNEKESLYYCEFKTLEENLGK